MHEVRQGEGSVARLDVGVRAVGGSPCRDGGSRAGRGKVGG